ncbi:MAG: DUF4091 domain-containing protein [Firmicutes bacterium]|nr:DUF4091 domain-containing protein [Bacillota bacterium]MCM1400609.1 DUF4091 domain-containing protein [Bacteroides sp.]
MKFSMPRTFVTTLLAAATISMSAANSTTPYVEPADTSTVDTCGWSSVTAPLTLSWASKDVHYRQRATPPRINVTDTTINAWRGERIGLEALAVASSDQGPLRVELSRLTFDGHSIDTPGSYAAPMRYVLTTAYNTCGYPSADLPTYTVADMIDLPGTTFSMAPRTVRPIWCSIELPRDLRPGLYSATLNLMSGNRKKPLASLKLNINVSNRTLPAPKDYAFYLDLWQQPYAIARYYGVAPWSDEHLKLLQPYAQMLARAGQKTVTTILFYEPWGEQSNDKFEPMVATTRHADGSWSYDYTTFDRYVDFMAKNGVDANISCFTMVPWEMKFRYFNEPTGRYEFLEAPTNSPEYAELWTSFLQSLYKHLAQKGWADKTMVVMDERGLPQMLDAYRVAKAAVPGIKMSLAGSYHKELIDSLDSYTLIKGDFFPADVLKRRHDNGQISLMYTCCATPAPSQFSNSAPADGAYLPVYSTATGHDGYLHWSFSNWTDNPLTDTRFRMFAPGDTYFVYPDGRSSLRYERMLEGIQMSEKINILRQDFEAARDLEGLLLLNRALEPIRSGAMNPWYPTSTVVTDLTRALTALSLR